MDSIFLKTLQGEQTPRPPVWFMRQAGRVLPSYLRLREKYSFWQLMKDPQLASDVTLLPINDLGVDASILFSDILVIPYAMGMGLEFTDMGPVFDNPLMRLENPLDALQPKPERLEYIYDAIDAIIEKSPENIPLIGFCGAPLTVMCFMIQGLGTKSNFTEAAKYYFRDKKTTKKIAEKITELSITYALKQIEHGISAFQLFDTHAGLVPFSYYEEIFLPSIKKIGDAVRDTGTPFIFFPKDAGTGIQSVTFDYCDFLSVDWQTSIYTARKMVDPKVGLQGNLDPRILYADKKVIEEELKTFLPFAKDNHKWIFNLGHGLMPGIPVENVKFVIDWIKNMNI